MIQFSISLSGDEANFALSLIGFAVGVLIYKISDRWIL